MHRGKFGNESVRQPYIGRILKLRASEKDDNDDNDDSVSNDFDIKDEDDGSEDV